MANYESIKPIIKRTMLDNNLSMAQLSIRLGKGTSYISNASRFGLTDSAKKQLLLLLQGISKRGIIANDLLKYEMELTENLRKEILRLENTINRVKQSNVDIGLYANELEHDISVIQNELSVCKSERLEYSHALHSCQFRANEREYGMTKDWMIERDKNVKKSNIISHLKNKLYIARNSVELSFMAGMFLLINFIGFLHAIAVILSGDVGLYDVLLGASNVLGVIFFVCIFEDILIDLED